MAYRKIDGVTDNFNNISNSQKTDTKIELEKFFCEYYKFQIHLKLLHFQTSKYSVHKIVDEYSDKFSASFDKLYEVYQGKYGRFILHNTYSISINNGENVVGNFENFLNGIKKVVKNSSAIDEFCDDYFRFKYLLTFS